LPLRASIVAGAAIGRPPSGPASLARRGDPRCGLIHINAQSRWKDLIKKIAGLLVIPFDMDRASDGDRYQTAQIVQRRIG